MDTRIRHLLISLALVGVAATGGFLFGRHSPSADSNLALRPFGGPCRDYIDMAKSGWFVDQWGYTSLRLVPTDCGRSIGSSDTPHMFYEIVKEFGDPERFGSAPSPTDRWKNVKGMINQLTCHFRIARNKPEWNIEPYRPWVGDDATDRADCNPH